ncbi:carbohydrate porin [Vibrio ulleungensis]|uniref:Carbohydrate porin n=1 Tax=Vibrio ulleungensis TaxID=2807619 RepID=A0ABS2HBZ1_9VIBR|nr:carbohydrate porin [Vibrio ulleungensis]MBM7035120.1 carbohydrate porin [Vibrio ulleungensis]
MKRIKLLPTYAVVVSSLCAPIVLADGHEGDGFYFSGYARYGLHYAGKEAAYVRALGETIGYGVGRLGNETNGGEFQLGKKLMSENGTNWDVAVMLDNYGSGVNIKKFYAKVSNVWDSQPNLTVWAGRDFHQRPQSGLNDYFLMSHDGQGGGFTNWEFGTVAFDASIVGQVDAADGSDVTDNGNYAFTSKLHGIGVGLGELSFLINYGFASDKGEVASGKGNSYHLAGVWDIGRDSGFDQLFIRYGDGADNSVFTRDEDLSTMLVHWQGQYNFTQSFELGYIAAWHDTTNKSPVTDVEASRSNYSLIFRPMYSWSDIHSTWVEAGYALVDFADTESNSAWKVTLSQNISFGQARSGDRPMLRFYATFGETENKTVIGAPDELLAGTYDTVSLGAMFEASW